jgi:hypothetical protein
MTNIWKQRPPSFPSDENFPFSAAVVNQFNDIEDLRVGNQTPRESVELRDSPPVKSKLSMRARDSIFVKKERKARNSAPQIFDNDNEDNENDEQSRRGVRFSVAMHDSNGRDNEAFIDDEVVLRHKNLNDPKELENYLAFYDIDDQLSRSST